MKKIYLLIFTGIFMLGSFVSQAASPYSTLSTGTPATPLVMGDPASWVGGNIPPQNCNSCEIHINSSMVINSLTVNPVLNNSTVYISGGATLIVDVYLQVNNTFIQVGSDATTTASVEVNDQIDLIGSTNIQLANINTFINSNNSGNNPVTGPHTDYIGAKSAGLYYLTGIDPSGFTQTLNVSGDGSQANNVPWYTINCDGTTPNTCGSGVIYGPATTVADLAPGGRGLIFELSATLPIQLVQFLATKNADATIRLSWATAQEINSASFDIERSADQGIWEKIGSVTAKGYSSTTANYSFTDQAPLPGNGYYRLKMIDQDGKFKYSKVVAVTSDKDNRPLVIYSNPFIDQIRLKVNVNRAQNLSLTVSDMMGKTYLKQSYNAQTGDNLINLVPGGAAGGMYILHIQGNTLDQTVKLVRQ